MKSKTIAFWCGLFAVLFIQLGFKPALTINNTYFALPVQEGLVVYATYDGHEDYGYNFVAKAKDDEEHTLTFQNVNESVLKNFDLNSDDFVGTKFKITFNKEVKVTKDEHGHDEEEEINTITLLEKL